MKKIFSIVMLIGVILLGFLLLKEKHHNDLLKEEVKKQSENQKTNANKKKSTIDNKEMVNKALVGKGFDTVLFKYNDVDVDKAMDTIPGTPQNLAHDGKRFYYFNSDATFRSTSVGSYAGAAGGSWKIDETHIILTMDAGAQFKIPYQIKDNTVLFPNWDDYSNGNKYTYQFIPDNSAKSYIEGKSLQS